MTRRRTTRIDAAARTARTHNLRWREVGPTRSRPGAQPAPAPQEQPECPAPLSEEEINRLKSGWKFLE